MAGYKKTLKSVGAPERRKSWNVRLVAKEEERLYEAEGILGRRGVNKFWDEVLVKWAGFHSLV